MSTLSSTHLVEPPGRLIADYHLNSFHQVGQQSSNVLTPAQVRKYAEHFIYWRRAIAIPPLHARDMYIVNPNCDMRKLQQASARWARQFPLLPALPNFLAELSVAPRPYKLHCPSKAHRHVYMQMLAWLMRGGWVTQLCTFAYVVVWPEIIYEVEYALEAEELTRAKRAQGVAREPPRSDTDTSLASPSLASPTSSISALVDTATAGFGFLSLLDDASDMASSTATLRPPNPSSDQDSSVASPLRRPGDPLSRGTSHDSSVSAASLSTPAEQAAEKARLERIADKAARDLAERAMAHARKAPPVRTAHPSVNSARHLVGISPRIILDAKKATGKESRYLSAIGQRLRDRAAAAGTGAAAPGAAAASKDAKGWEARVAETWPLFWKYFNGRSALERIALQEEMKRKDVWNLLTAMSEFLICVRHW